MIAKRFLLALAWVAALAPVPGLVAAVNVSARAEFLQSPSSTREYKAILRHLRSPFRGYGAMDVLASQFGVVALSHMACGLLNVVTAEPQKRDEVQAALSEVVRRALSPSVSPIHAGTTASTPLDDHNLFWSHLGLILGIERYVRCEGRPCAPATEADRLQERIAAHLRARTAASPLFHAASYPGSPRWPADQSVTLLALKMHDKATGGSQHEDLLRGYLRVLRREADARTGLFPSAVAGVADGGVPRGCATSWTVLYLVQLDAEAAREQYTRARDALGISVLGIGGFREWPRGRSGPGDLDSGPIVLGVGTAATGLGLGPAHMFQDDRPYTLIRRAALIFGLPAWWPSGGYLSAPLLGQAILFNGRTAIPWFGSISPVAPEPVPWPVAPVIFAILDVLLLAALTRAFVRTWNAGAGSTPSNHGADAARSAAPVRVAGARGHAPDEKRANEHRRNGRRRKKDEGPSRACRRTRGNASL